MVSLASLSLSLAISKAFMKVFILNFFHENHHQINNNKKAMAWLGYSNYISKIYSSSSGIHCIISLSWTHVLNYISIVKEKYSFVFRLKTTEFVFGEKQWTHSIRKRPMYVVYWIIQIFSTKKASKIRIKIPLIIDMFICITHKYSLFVSVCEFC